MVPVVLAIVADCIARSWHDISGRNTCGASNLNGIDHSDCCVVSPRLVSQCLMPCWVVGWITRSIDEQAQDTVRLGRAILRSVDEQA